MFQDFLLDHRLRVRCSNPSAVPSLWISSPPCCIFSVHYVWVSTIFISITKESMKWSLLASGLSCFSAEIKSLFVSRISTVLGFCPILPLAVIYCWRNQFLVTSMKLLLVLSPLAVECFQITFGMLKSPSIAILDNDFSTSFIFFKNVSSYSLLSVLHMELNIDSTLVSSALRFDGK